MGIVARHTGQHADAYRPRDAFCALRPENRFLRLPALFEYSQHLPAGFTVDGNLNCHGIFDAAYTRPGDYLVADDAIYFIASQEPLQPVLCIRCNHTVSISRPYQQASQAGTGYAGYSPTNAQILIEAYPAAVLTQGRSGSTGVGLPTDEIDTNWLVRLPAPQGVTLNIGDFILDDLGRTAVIASTELTFVGWSLVAKMATT